MKKMNNIYEAPMAEVIEMNMNSTVLTTSTGDVNPPYDPEGEDTF
jgi:hypothetical protein